MSGVFNVFDRESPKSMTLLRGVSVKSNRMLIGKTVLLADEAINRFLASKPKGFERPIIAASMGPYGASLGDGSEYRGNYGVSVSDLQEFHISRIKIINASNADIFAFETIPDYKEAGVLAEQIEILEKPAWVSFSCRDEIHINDGTPLEKCLELFSELPEVFAIGVNCTAPEYIPDLIDILKKKSENKRILVYPNSGEVYSPETKTWSGIEDPETCEKMGVEWLKRGADIIGGCCRMGPEHIRSLYNAIKNFDK